MGRLSNHAGSTPPPATRTSPEHRGYCKSCGQLLPDTDDAFEAPAELQPMWEPVQAKLREQTPDFKYHIWLEPLRLAGGAQEHLFVWAPEHIRSWVIERYHRLLEGAARAVYGDAVTVQIVGDHWRPRPGQDRPHLVPPAGSLPGRESPPRRRRRSDV